MLEFRAPVLEDRAALEPMFRGAEQYGCEYNFVNFYLWSSVYSAEFTVRDGWILIHYGACRYHFPVGSGDPTSALQLLLDDAEQRGGPAVFLCVTPEQYRQMEGIWPGRWQAEPARDSFDYLYEIDRLADLGGRKLQAKRNHINRFVERYPDWHTEAITPENLSVCAALNTRWELDKTGSEAGVGDQEVLRRALDGFAELGLEGLILYGGGEPLGFTFGYRMLEQVFDVHFEKAPASVQGAFPLINREMARAVRARYPEVRYLNREEDMGLPGLRKAKESYHPDRMEEKWTVVWRAE